ncbi:Y-family DNA polymerase [Spiribacter halobius]|uniref:DNA polymerase Y family protein n=1 Tax=Sediminicurvatus halobius TaxID=2182432 RepID=A0A2U2MY02_9GAMM|nr:DNA polymerase Y family protein [Spiribacter halobius]PWG61663.1 DNA polymerase Y family protein [Spiribacter halobius]UEX79438.1 DNA polymerase Y family protein [Spiribacter halobius]
MLWLCLYLPELPLTVFTRAADAALPFAVAEGREVLAVNAAARSGGVLPGMSLAAAGALLPELHHRERRRDSEARALKQLAAWSLRFTPRVSLQPPAAVLLEIGGSLRYFGGLERLMGRVRDGAARLGHRLQTGIAPTPTAAWLLARAGETTPVLETGELAGRLDGLPVETLALEARQQDALRGLGVETLGELYRLPRAGIARRLGPGLLRQLARAYGEQPDPRRDWQPPPRFRSRLELTAEVAHAAQLRPGFSQLIEELCGYLQGLGAGVRTCRVTLEHLHQAATPVTVGLLAPAREATRLLALLDEQLERVRLPAGVIAIELAAGTLEALAAETGNLLDGDRGGPADAGWEQLVETLAARLGERTVRGLAVHEEHRPERAWRYARPGAGAAAPTAGERPLWLLPQPEPLSTAGGLPRWRGPLVLEHGPERIESGWWDGTDTARDYYVAHNPEGERLWIYRDRRAHRGWYLHGLFA